MTPEQVSKALADRRLQRVSEATGIHYNTLKKIRDGESKKPTHDVMSKLIAYLEQRND